MCLFYKKHSTCEPANLLYRCVRAYGIYVIYQVSYFNIVETSAMTLMRRCTSFGWIGICHGCTGTSPLSTDFLMCLAFGRANLMVGLSPEDAAVVEGARAEEKNSQQLRTDVAHDRTCVASIYTWQTPGCDREMELLLSTRLP